MNETTRQQKVLSRHVRREGTLRTAQARAELTRDRLLESGRILLADRDLDAVSIAELAAAIGSSVGSFYGRFRDKESYFALLQELIIAEWIERSAAEFDERRMGRLSTRRLLERAASFVVAILGGDRGFVRAAIRHSLRQPSAWTPMERAAALFGVRVEALLASRLTGMTARVRQQRVRFALQLIYGSVLNAVLHDPGPLRLQDPRFARELGRAAAAYLEVAPRGASQVAIGPRSSADMP